MTSIAHDRGAQAVQRSTLYAVLSRCLDYPTAESLAETRRDLAALSRDSFPISTSRLIDALAGSIPADLEGIQKVHQTLFPPIESQETPGFETAFRGPDVFMQTAVMADVAGFYRAFGLQPGRDHRERPDHIAVELEFLAFVSMKEAVGLSRGDDGQAEVCRQAEARFLADHLGDWGPELGRRMSRLADDGLFGVLGSLLDAWIGDRMAQVGVEPTGGGGLVTADGTGSDDGWEPISLVPHP